MSLKQPISDCHVIDELQRKLAELKNKLLAPPNLTEFSSEIIARTNWKFVEKLLNDCRIKVSDEVT